MSRLLADLQRAEVCIADLEGQVKLLEAQLADASHRAITATEEARVAKGILAKVRRFEEKYGLGFGLVHLTDAESALFDTITKETT